MDRLYRHAPLAFSRAKFSNFPSFSVADTDLQIRGSNGHPDPEIRGRGGRSQKKVFRPFGPQFGLQIRRTKPPGPLPWICHWFLNAYHAFYNPGQSSLDISMCFVISRHTTIISNGNKVPPTPSNLCSKLFWSKSSRVHFWCYRKQHWNRVGEKRAFNLRRFFGRTIAKNKYFCNVYQQVLSEVVASYMWEFKPRDISLSSPVPLVVTFCCLTQVLPVFPASLSIEHFDLT